MKLRSTRNCLVSLALVTAGVSACATPNAPAKLVPLASSSHERVVIPDSGALRSDQLDAWWRLYDSATLNTLVAQALSTSPDATIIASRIEQARTIRLEARGNEGLRGDLALTASDRRSNRLSGSSDAAPRTRNAELEASLPLSWEVDFWNRRSLREKTADADLASRVFASEAAHALLAAEVVTTFFAIQSIDARIEEARAQLEIQRQLLGLVRVRAERGLAARLDPKRIEIGLHQSEAAITNLNAQKSATTRALGGLLGQPSLNVDFGRLGETPPTPPKLLEAAILARRPDVRQSLAGIDSIRAQSELARLDFMPKLTFSPSLGLTALLEPASASSALWSIGIGASLPVLDRNRLRAVVGTRRAQQSEAIGLFEKSVQTALSEVDQAMSLYQGDMTRLNELRSAQEAGAISYRAAQRRYQAGLDSLDPVLDNERVWRESRDASLEARISSFERSVQVFKALGGGWHPPQAQNHSTTKIGR